MIRIIGYGIQWTWVAFGILWLIAALTSKRSIRVQSSGSRLFQSCLLILGIMLMSNFRNWITNGWLTIRLMPVTLPVFAGGAALTLAGLLFCVWARVVLGTNWSGTVAVKVGHELVNRGPYRWVRHPIYTGALIALLGSGLAAGQVRGLLAFLIALLALWFKSQAEERWMLGEFGERYVAYRRTTWALLPFIL